MWLPIDVEAVFGANDIFGRKWAIGSVPRLRNELESLHRSVLSSRPTFKSGRDDVARLERSEFWAMASQGLRIWLDLARIADERRLPMILDW
jgi:hypothetical protein